MSQRGCVLNTIYENRYFDNHIQCDLNKKISLKRLSIYMCYDFWTKSIYFNLLIHDTLANLNTEDLYWSIFIFVWIHFIFCYCLIGSPGLLGLAGVRGAIRGHDIDMVVWNHMSFVLLGTLTSIGVGIIGNEWLQAWPWMAVSNFGCRWHCTMFCPSLRFCRPFCEPSHLPLECGASTKMEYVFNSVV